MFLIYHYIDSIKKQLRKRERYPEMNPAPLMCSDNTGMDRQDLCPPYSAH